MAAKLNNDELQAIYSKMGRVAEKMQTAIPTRQDTQLIAEAVRSLAFQIDRLREQTERNHDDGR